jgi:muconolactone delta-isomerase
VLWLPLFPIMAINVTALARHASAIDAREAAGRWQCRPSSATGRPG